MNAMPSQGSHASAPQFGKLSEAQQQLVQDALPGQAMPDPGFDKGYHFITVEERTHFLTQARQRQDDLRTSLPESQDRLVRLRDEIEQAETAEPSKTQSNKAKKRAQADLTRKKGEVSSTETRIEMETRWLDEIPAQLRHKEEYLGQAESEALGDISGADDGLLFLAKIIQSGETFRTTLIQGLLSKIKAE